MPQKERRVVGRKTVTTSCLVGPVESRPSQASQTTALPEFFISGPTAAWSQSSVRCIPLLRWSLRRQLQWPVGDYRYPFTGNVALVFDGKFIWHARPSTSMIYKQCVDGTGEGQDISGCPGVESMAFDGETVWALDRTNGRIFKISAIAVIPQQPYATINLGANPYKAAFDGTHMWVTCSDNTVKKIEKHGTSIVGSIPMGAATRAISYDGSHIWVSSGGSSIAKIDITTDTVVGTFGIGLSSGTDNMVFDGTHLWCSGPDASIKKVDYETGTVDLTIAASANRGLMFDGFRIWGISSDPAIRAFDMNTGSVELTQPNAAPLNFGTPSDVCYDGECVWVACSGEIIKLLNSMKMEV